MNILGMLGLSYYILADTFFVSKAMGTKGLAALNIALPVFNCMLGIGFNIFYITDERCLAIFSGDRDFNGNVWFCHICIGKN